LEWEVLKKSDLDWTLVRPPRIANEPASGNISADEKKSEMFWIDSIGNNDVISNYFSPKGICLFL
jgi:hypothetical protein